MFVQSMKQSIVNSRLSDVHERAWTEAIVRQTSPAVDMIIMNGVVSAISCMVGGWYYPFFPNAGEPRKVLQDCRCECVCVRERFCIFSHNLLVCFVSKALPSPYSGGKGFFATSQRIMQFQEGFFRERKVSK